MSFYAKAVRTTQLVIISLLMAVAGSGLTHVPVAQAATCATTVIKRGAKNTCVTYAQQLLNSSGKAGSAMLATDGVFGAGTDTATRTFQTNAKLVADGIIGTNTWNALCASPYTGRVSPIGTLNNIRTSAGCPASTYVAAPAVKITSPISGSQVGGGVMVNVNATDADGIASVVVALDGATVASKTSTPYSFYVNTSTLSVGTHALSAVATDNIGTTSNTTINLSTSDVSGDSTAIPCAAGSTDLGILNGYSDGVVTPVRVCAVTSLPSTSDESNPAKPYYIAGANGYAVINSRLSQQVVSMVAAAKASGVTLRATSAFRTMQHQIDLCNANAACKSGNDYSAVAQPGYSMHQLGIAIDFSGPTATGTDMNTCAARAVSPSSTVWTWLYNNGDTYGMKQYTYEAWHWDASNLTNRCGFGQGF